MNTLLIEKQTGGYFKFTLNGDTANAITSINNDLLAVGNQLHFKTGNGANIIKEQFIYPADVTIVSGGTFTFTTVAQVWDKLIAIDYFAWLGGGGTGGVDRFDDLLDTFSYTGNAGKAVVVDNSELKLVPITLYNKRLFTELEDTPSSLVPDKMVVVNPAGTALIFQDQPEPPTEYLNSVGYFDYNDLATQTTPLNAMANVALKLTNDTEGANTSTDQNPYGVSYVWDYTTNQFNFSELEVGDTIDVRVHVQVTTTTSNQKVSLKAKFGIGSVSQFENSIFETTFKSSGLHEISFVAPFYMGSTYITDYPAELYLTTDASATVKVDGWYVRILRKNINIITVDYQVEDATTTTKGIVRLAGDLSGTANNPTVPELANKVPTSRTIGTTSPLTGGGALSSNVTVGIQQGGSTQSGYITSADWIRFDEAHSDRIVSAGVSGTTTKTLTLTQDDGGTLTTSWTDINTGIWGSIIGNLPDQLDLKDALDLKVPTSRTITTTAPLQGGGTLGSDKTLSITQATTSTNGYLSSIDWNIFNGKQNAINGTGFVKASGTTISYDNTTYTPTARTISTTAPLSGGGDMSANRTLSIAQATTSVSGFLSSTDWNTFNGKQNFIAAGTTAQYYRGDKTFQTLDKTAIGLANVDNTSDLSKPISTATQSALDLKQNNLSGTGIVKSTAGVISYLTDNTANWDAAYSERNNWDGGNTSLNASTGRSSLGASTLGSNLFTSTNPSAITFLRVNADNTVSWLDAAAFRTAIDATSGAVTGTGTTNYIPKFTGSSAIGNSAITDNTTFIGMLNGRQGLTLGANSDGVTLTNNTNKRGRINVPQYGTTTGLPIGIIQGNASVSSNTINIGGIQSGYSLAADSIEFYIGATYNATTANQIARFFSTGNLLLQNGGTFTDAGFRLDVNGNQAFRGTTSSDTAPLGSELLTTGTGDASWTGTSFATGYTHVAGSVTTLTSTLAAVVSTFYQIAYTVTGRTAGSFTIDFGGVTRSNITTTGSAGPQATSTGTLVITPTTDFNGTIVLSIKTIGTSSATSSFFTSTGVLSNEIRVSNYNSNSFIGIGSGRRNTTGNVNAFFGNQSGINNTTGSANAFFGINSGYTNTLGNNNSFFGIYSGQSNTLGGGNTAIGRSALFANTTGSNNNTLGESSLSANTTGSSNVAFGSNALTNSTTGNSNVAIGLSSLQNLTGANNNNTAIGTNAGRYAGSGTTAMTSFSNSIYVGFQSRGLNATGSTNEIVIGYDVVGLGSNTTIIGNTSTTATAIYGDLLLGGTTDNGTDKLQVTGSANITGQLKLGSTITNGTFTYTLPGATGTLALAGDIPTSIVTTFSAGTTGLTPNTATSGAITLGGTLVIANGGTGSTTAAGARTNLGATTVGSNMFTLTNPGAITFPRFNADNTVSALDAASFRTAIGAGTGNGTVTSVEAVGGYGGLTLTGTVTGSGQLTLGGTPTGSWPISITGNAASVNTVQVSTNADFYLTFADANNGSPTSEFLYTIGTVKVNPSTGALTAGSFVKSGGTSSQFLMADGSVSTGSGGTVTGTGTSGQIAYWNGTSSITGESNLFWDSTNDRLGIGTTTDFGVKLAVSGNMHVTNSDARIKGGDVSGRLILSNSDTTSYVAINGSSNTNNIGIITNSEITFNTGGSYAERMRIFSSGNVFIGSSPTDAGYKLDVNGGSAFRDTLRMVASGVDAAYLSWTGSNTGVLTLLHSGATGTQILASGASTFNGTVTATGFFNSSDNRLKDLTDYDYNVSDIKPITYLWKDGRDNKKHVGYSAQEVQKVMPDAVNEDEKGFLSVNYVEVLVAKIEAMEKEIAYLKSKI